MHLAVGMLAGLFHAIKTGEGQIVDSAMIDGSASLMGFFIIFIMLVSGKMKESPIFWMALPTFMILTKPLIKNI